MEEKEKNVINKLYVEKKVSAKSQKEYVALYIDLGWKVELLTCESMVICDIFNMTPRDLMTMPLNEKRYF